VSDLRPPGLLVCWGCGYNLADHRGGCCPECGGLTVAYETRPSPSAADWCAAGVLVLQFVYGAFYFAVNPNGLAGFGLNELGTSALFASVYIGGIASGVLALLKPRRRLLAGAAAAWLGLAGLFAVLAVWVLSQTVHPLGEPLTILLIAGLLTLNTVSWVALGHRLLYRSMVHTPISANLDAQVGILGAGQLGRMLGLAGVPLGVRCRFLDAHAVCPAAAVGEVVHQGFEIGPHLDRFASGVGVVTYEFENVPVAVAEHLAQHATVRPSPRSLEIAQDRLRERELFASLGIDSPRWAAVGSFDDLAAVIDNFPMPAILKTRRMGYDGKGQARLATPGDARAAWDAIGRVPAILDEMIPFVREVSVVAVRGVDGQTRCYPPVENVHRGGILRRSIAPAPGLSPERGAELERATGAIAEALGHVGVLAVEFFETADGRVLANEFAPRVHNTGHWTIEGAQASQFENHLRAILGLPLGSTEARGHAAMVNIIGDWPDREALLRIPGLHLHDYDKASRAGRKIGHLTVVETDEGAMRQRLAAIEALVDPCHG